MIDRYDPDHGSWPILKEELVRRVERSRAALEQPGLDAVATEFERGQVAALRSIISDVEEPPLERVRAPGYE